MARRKHGLIVDDEMDVCETIRDAIEDVCDVQCAYTHEQAAELLEGRRFDVVILDIMGVRGFDLLARFGAKHPCIVLTGRSLTPDDLAKAIEHRARLFLPKEHLFRIREYVEEVLGSTRSLWSWLFGKVAFSRWFGEDWESRYPELVNPKPLMHGLDPEGAKLGGQPQVRVRFGGPSPRGPGEG